MGLVGGRSSEKGGDGGAKTAGSLSVVTHTPVDAGALIGHKVTTR